MKNFLEHILLSDQATDDDRRRLADLCASDTDTAAATRRLAGLVGRVREMESAGLEREMESEFEAAWIAEFGAQPAQPVRHATVYRLRNSLRWVAAAAIIVSAGLFSYIALTPGQEPVRTIAAAEAEFLVHTLEDGSTVRLSPGARISVLESGDLELVGSAFFSISPLTS